MQAGVRSTAPAPILFLIAIALFARAGEAIKILSRSPENRLGDGAGSNSHRAECVEGVLLAIQTKVSRGSTFDACGDVADSETPAPASWWCRRYVGTLLQAEGVAGTGKALRTVASEICEELVPRENEMGHGKVAPEIREVDAFTASCVRFAENVPKSSSGEALKECQARLGTSDVGGFCSGYASLIRRGAGADELQEFCSVQYGILHGQTTSTLAPVSTTLADTVVLPVPTDEEMSCRTRVDKISALGLPPSQAHQVILTDCQQHVRDRTKCQKVSQQFTQGLPAAQVCAVLAEIASDAETEEFQAVCRNVTTDVLASGLQDDALSLAAADLCADRMAVVGSEKHEESVRAHCYLLGNRLASLRPPDALHVIDFCTSLMQQEAAAHGEVIFEPLRGFSDSKISVPHKVEVAVAASANAGATVRLREIGFPETPSRSARSPVTVNNLNAQEDVRTQPPRPILIKSPLDSAVTPTPRGQTESLDPVEAPQNKQKQNQEQPPPEAQSGTENQLTPMQPSSQQLGAEQQFQQSAQQSANTDAQQQALQLPPAQLPAQQAQQRQVQQKQVDQQQLPQQVPPKQVSQQQSQQGQQQQLQQQLPQQMPEQPLQQTVQQHASQVPTQQQVATQQLQPVVQQIPSQPTESDAERIIQGPITELAQNPLEGISEQLSAIQLHGQTKATTAQGITEATQVSASDPASEFLNSFLQSYDMSPPGNNPEAVFSANPPAWSSTRDVSQDINSQKNGSVGGALAAASNRQLRTSLLQQVQGDHRDAATRNTRTDIDRLLGSFLARK